VIGLLCEKGEEKKKWFLEIQKGLCMNENMRFTAQYARQCTMEDKERRYETKDVYMKQRGV
jgi:hypothetical protein